MKGTTYFLDPSLKPKVEEYLRAHGGKVNIEIMTEFLIENNKEFHKKKKKFFMKSVTKAYNEVKPNLSFDEVNLCEGEEEVNEVESPAAINMKRQEFSVDSLYRSPSSESRRLSSNNLPLRVNGQTPRSANQTSLKMSEVSNKVYTANSDDDIIYVGDDSEKLRNSEFGKNHANTEAAESFLKIAKKKRKKISLLANDSEIIFPESKKKKQNIKYETVMPSGNHSDMVGMESLLRILSYLCSINLIIRNLEKKPSSCKSLLLNGPEGSGKSLLVSNLAEHFDAKLIKISAKEFLPVFGKPASEESVLDSVFKHALANGPCILHIENLHHLPVDTGLNKNADSKVITDLVDKINDVNKNYADKPILIIGELRYQQSQIIDSSLRAIFEKEIYIPGLNENARLVLLQKFCPYLELEDVKEIAHKTTSYVAGDLVKLVSEARQFSIMRINDKLMEPPSMCQTFSNCIEHYNVEESICKEDINEVIKTMTPVLKRSGFPCIPETKMEEIGGLEDVKLEIRNKILLPIQHEELFRKYGKDVLHGILLYGPPGCGKTLLAKAIANEAGLNFLIVNSGEMLKMYQGESERAIRENFRLAASVKPCIIFFDEFDCIASTRVGGSESGSRQSIVNTLLSEMDGIINRVGVYIMACTNRPDVIDPALLRPGRLDTKLYVGLPDDAGRRSILRAITKEGTLPPIASDVNLSEISSMCTDFSGADLDNLISEAKRMAIDREMKLKSKKETMEFYGITNDDLKCALNKVYPSVSRQDRRHYMQMKSKYEGSFVAKPKKPEVELKDVSIQVEPSIVPDETS